MQNDHCQWQSIIILNATNANSVALIICKIERHRRARRSKWVIAKPVFYRPMQFQCVIYNWMPINRPKSIHWNLKNEIVPRKEALSDQMFTPWMPRICHGQFDMVSGQSLHFACYNIWAGTRNLWQQKRKQEILYKHNNAEAYGRISNYYKIIPFYEIRSV